MRSTLFAFFLAACFLSEAASAYSAIDPYAANGTLIRDPLFDSAFISQLQSEGVLPIIYDGSVGFYVADNRTCIRSEGELCAAIPCGNAICGSRMLGNETLGKSVIDTGVVFGNQKTHDALAMQNALRYSTMPSEQHISLLEQEIARSQGSALDMKYIDERYGGSVDELIKNEILAAPELKGLDALAKSGDTDGAVRMLDEYFRNNYGVSQAYDTRDIFSAVKERQIGPMQYSEILSRILGQKGMGADIAGLMDKSGILNEELNRQMIDAALEAIKEHPELMDELKKSMDAIDERMFNDVLAKALEESLQNKELMNQLLRILPDIMKDEKMRNTFLKSASEAMRQMQASGALDELMKNIGDEKIRDKILDYAKESAPSALERAVDEVKRRIKWDYALPAIAFIIIIIASMKVRL